MTMPLTALILARDGIILGCAGYLRFVSLPSPRTLARYFDVTLATVKFTPTTISKANTAIQLGLVAATLAAPVFSFVGHPALQAFCADPVGEEDTFARAAVKSGLAIGEGERAAAAGLSWMEQHACYYQYQGLEEAAAAPVGELGP
ncbi:hypothetical protein HPB47_018295 [Ixodes persulcatus]|uniref:Uncharacterized protein n=1 Tax=Ixodes persulcatus TaxID=34615 RepID=A0AC60QNN9_IXOPE|nr:hypothetical protein HPB47_018295 [Ixodes persulcatus]